MSDTPKNPTNPETDSSNNSDLKYELITAYIDNEITDESELELIKNLIENNSDFRNRYELEKATKQFFKARLDITIETPVYLYKNIGKGIDDYIKTTGKRSVQKKSEDMINTQMSIQKSNLKRNLTYASIVFVLLIVSAFALNSFLSEEQTIYAKNDIITVSKKVFDKFKNGNRDIQFKTNDAKELSNDMNQHLDFKVYIPNVKEAVLIGGFCSIEEGEKTAHIIHMKGNIRIYTFQTSMNNLQNRNNLTICEKVKSSINSGENWINCSKVDNLNPIIWFADGVICSSYSDMEPDEIHSTLTNFK
ncbi:MAG TPA: hypothetical protein PK294_05250 [Ignavibacteria bacterium]|nr:hypothetical protein [Ignavibacteria bacterium]